MSQCPLRAGITKRVARVLNQQQHWQDALRGRLATNSSGPKHGRGWSRVLHTWCQVHLPLGAIMQEGAGPPGAAPHVGRLSYDVEPGGRGVGGLGWVSGYPSVGGWGWGAQPSALRVAIGGGKSCAMSGFSGELGMIQGHILGRAVHRHPPTAAARGCAAEHELHPPVGCGRGRMLPGNQTRANYLRECWERWRVGSSELYIVHSTIVHGWSTGVGMREAPYTAAARGTTMHRQFFLTGKSLLASAWNSLHHACIEKAFLLHF